MATIRPTVFHGKPAVEVGNDAMSLTVLTGGGHIARATAPGCAINPLWEPPWTTVPPSLRRLAARDADAFSAAAADAPESELLACLGGHSLACDVFGAHSPGEAPKAAGQKT